MYQSKEGPVIYRAYRCLGCRYCQAACPFGIPCFEWDNGITPVISKCFMCYDRLQEGLIPACAQACPAGALQFGQRDKLLVKAHAQIAAYPGRYVDHVFGEYEVGGTSMLYLSDVHFERLGFPADMPHEATPEGTEKILGKLPFVLLGMATLMGGTAAYTHRGPAIPHSPGEPAQTVIPGPASDQPEEE
jgi:formate dehydrogenase iron-sulfur subunit